MSKERIDDVNYIKNVSGNRKKFKPYFLFMIRFAETFAANFIPSALGVNIVFKNPTPGAWAWTSAVVFIISAVLNCVFWGRYVRSRNNSKDFYIMNGTIYAIYAIVSVAMLHSEKLGAVIFSIMFANLRVFENFIGTVNSVYVTNLFMLLLMIICERVFSIRLNRQIARMAENGMEKIEMIKDDDSVTPTQQNKTVKFMSVADLQEHDEIEIEDDMKKIEAFYSNLPEKIWDEKMTKGQGEEIVYETEDIIEDEKEENKSDNYSSSALWENDIYRGRTPDDTPITEYEEAFDDGFEEPEMAIDSHLLADYDEENLWGNISKGVTRDEDDNEEWIEQDKKSINPNAAYDSDHLWDNVVSKSNDDDSEAENKEQQSEKDINPNADYDEERLWDNIDDSRRKDPEAKKEAEEVNPNADYDEENLWSNITRGNSDAEYDIGEEIKNDTVNPNAAYDSDNLWGEIVKGTGNEAEDSDENSSQETEINPNADYDEDHLWGEIDMSRRKGEDYYTEGKNSDDKFNPIEEYDTDSMWRNISDERLKPEDYYETGKNSDDKFNPIEEYDTDSMWRNISEERLKPEDYYATGDHSNENINPNADYDADRLWENIDENRRRRSLEISHDENTNPEKDYSPEQLWDKALYKGRKRNEE